MNRFGRVLRELRTTSRLTGMELAHRIQSSQGAISQYESGSILPTKSVIFKLAKEFGLPQQVLAWFIYEKAEIPDTLSNIDEFMFEYLAKILKLNSKIAIG